MTFCVPPALAEIFGIHDDAYTLIDCFDFSRVKIDESQPGDDTLTYGLAPSFGSLEKESFKLMDEKLKIMITATIRAIEGIKMEDRTWETVYSTLLQNTFLEPLGDEIVRVDRLERDGYTWFKFEDTPEQLVVSAVEAWFAKLLSDEDVLQATPIKIRGLATVVAATGARIQSLSSIPKLKAMVAQEITRQKTVVDIGVLRFPDFDNPYFKVYRIRLDARGYSSNTLGIQKNNSGIVGYYNCRKFKPRDSVIERVKDEAKKFAAQEAERLLGFTPGNQVVQSPVLAE